MTTLEKVMNSWTKSRDSLPIKVKLSKHKKFWELSFEEDYGITDDAGVRYSSGELDRRVLWASEELNKWNGVRRMAWPTWYFIKKRDAEKFITLYYLIWGQ
jgi:hypothetical protein